MRSLETKVPLRLNEVSEFLLSESEGSVKMELLLGACFGWVLAKCIMSLNVVHSVWSGTYRPLLITCVWFSDTRYVWSELLDARKIQRMLICYLVQGIFLETPVQGIARREFLICKKERGAVHMHIHLVSIAACIIYIGSSHWYEPRVNLNNISGVGRMCFGPPSLHCSLITQSKLMSGSWPYFG